MENAFQRQWTRIFETNAVVEGGCFYDDRKRTVLETHDKQSRSYDSTDAESTTFCIGAVVGMTLFITCSTTVLLRPM